MHSGPKSPSPEQPNNDPLMTARTSNLLNQKAFRPHNFSFTSYRPRSNINLSETRVLAHPTHPFKVSWLNIQFPRPVTTGTFQLIWESTLPAGLPNLNPSSVIPWATTTLFSDPGLPGPTAPHFHPGSHLGEEKKERREGTPVF